MINSHFMTAARQKIFNTIAIPDDKEAITDIDKSGEISTKDAHLSEHNIQAIWQAVERVFATGAHPGVGFCLRHKGQVVLNRTLGFSQGIDAGTLDQKITMSLSTPLCLFSASKAVTAMLIHKLAEEGYVNLLHPIANYIPEFGILGKEKISIYQMLSHHGGFPSVRQSPGADALIDRKLALDAIYKTPSRSPDGRKQAYHAVTSGYIADELVRRTTGKTIDAYLFEKFTRPMGMQYFRFGLEEQYRPLAAHNYVTGVKIPDFFSRFLTKALGVSIEKACELSNEDAFMNAIIPAGNIYATAEEISRFYQMLLDGGSFNGQQILKPETIDLAVKEWGPAQLDRTLFLPIRFSAGFMLGGRRFGMYGSESEDAFGHLGFSNIICWADPKRQISVAFICTGKPLIGHHIAALLKMVQAIARSTL